MRETDRRTQEKNVFTLRVPHALTEELSPLNLIFMAPNLDREH